MQKIRTTTEEKNLQKFHVSIIQILVVSAGLISPILSVPLPADPAPAPAAAAPAADTKSTVGSGGVATTRTHHKKHPFGFGGLYGGGLGYGAGLGYVSIVHTSFVEYHIEINIHRYWMNL